MIAIARRVRAWAALLVLSALATPACAQDDADEAYAIHGQVIFVEQFHPAFRSPYQGANSLDAHADGDETIAATLAAGVRLWRGGQLYVDPEIDQGFGLSNSYGIAAFPSGEAYKVGASTPYFRLQQLFFRQEFDLGGEMQSVDADFNQLGMHATADNVVVTFGKYAVTAVFDTNVYAHDPTSDFLNWAVIDAGAFDYAADSWGYSYGESVEWTQSWWTLREGVFALSRVPNSRDLQTDFSQFEIDGEAEARFRLLFGQQSKVKLLGFLNRARMGSYDDAVALGLATHAVPDTTLVRRYNSKPGLSLNVEQPITDKLGAFLRASFNNGETETYEFTEINQSVSAGLSLKGASWNRAGDTVGLAVAVDGLSDAARRYFAAGGIGTLIGDGQLPRYATENVIEAYYNAAVTPWLRATLDYQFVDHPAYNPDRGPVSVFGFRLHAAF